MSGGRRILITGSSRGLGLALAKHYLAQGDQVFGCARSGGCIEHSSYQHIRADVTREDEVRCVMQAVRNAGGRLDALINNAGVGRMLPALLMPVGTARQMTEVNFVGTFLMTNHAVRLLRKSTLGRIVNFSSVAVPMRLEGEAVYAAVKSAVETFTRILARELGPFGITCNAVGPTPIPTDLIRGVPDEKIDALINRQAVAIRAQAEDVANVIDFFLRPESRLITGQVIYLGGFG